MQPSGGIMPQASSEASRSESSTTVKLRKGTTSCWECKNRKIRCCFSFESPTVCISCRRRRCDCVPQDLPNPDDDQNTELDSRYLDIGEKIVRVETLVKSLVRERTKACSSGHSAAGPLRRPLSKKRAREVAIQQRRIQYRLQPRMIKDPANDYFLSRMISSCLPTVHIAAIILGGGIFTVQDRDISRRSEDSASRVSLGHVPAPPPPTAHPATLAKYLLQLATRLQDMTLESITPELQIHGCMRDLAQQYFDTASRYVTSQTSLVLSIDGLETLVLEILYLANRGNWRFAWLVCRRAMSIAQTLGLHLPRKRQPRDERNPQHAHPSSPVYSVWPLLVYADLYMSLLFGCAPAAIDNPNDTPPSEDHSKELDRVHVAVMRKLIRRNEKIRRGMEHGMGRNDQYEETRAIDYDLKRAARALSHAWWKPPHADLPDTDTTVATTQLILQIHHYNLILLLHLPYIVPTVAHKSPGASAELKAIVPDYTYSKLSSVAAGRDLICRFTIYHNSGSFPFSSRGLGFKAFIAGTVMLLAHISGQSQDLENPLEHQRRYDIRVISDLISTLEEVDSRSDDPLSQSSVRILKKLMEIHGCAEDGVRFLIWSDRQAPVEHGFRFLENDQVVEFSMPYFNKIFITKQTPGYAGPLRGWNEVRPGYLSAAGSIEIDELPQWWPQSRQKFLEPIEDSSESDDALRLPSPQATKLMDRSLDWPIEGSNSTGLHCVMPGALEPCDLQGGN